MIYVVWYIIYDVWLWQVIEYVICTWDVKYGKQYMRYDI